MHLCLSIVCAELKVRIEVPAWLETENPFLRPNPKCVITAVFSLANFL